MLGLHHFHSVAWSQIRGRLHLRFTVTSRIVPKMAAVAIGLFTTSQVPGTAGIEMVKSVDNLIRHHQYPTPDSMSSVVSDVEKAGIIGPAGDAGQVFGGEVPPIKLAIK